MTTVSFVGTTNTLIQDNDARWVRHTSYSVNAQIVSGVRARRSANGASAYYFNEAPSSADYSTQCSIWVGDPLSAAAVGPTGRMSTSADTYYSARYNAATLAWELIKSVSGTITTLYSSAATLTSGSTYIVTLKMVGSSISIYVNGSLLSTVTDTSISAAGYGGIRFAATTSPSTTNQLQIAQYVTLAVYEGSLSATEVGSDQFGASGSEIAIGIMDVVESSSDEFAATGSLLISGSLAVVESSSDEFQASGDEFDASEGSLAVIEPTVDTFASSGSVVSLTTGSMSVVETTSDIFSAAAPSEQVTNYLGLKVFPFPPNWSQSPTESLQWRTDVLTAYNGKEQRRSLSVQPRRAFEYSFIVREVNARRLESLIYGWQDGPVILPVWTDRMKSTAAVNAGSKIIPMSTATYGVRVGDPITIYDSPSVFEVHQVKTFTSAQIELETGLVRSWPIGSSVYPSVVAHMPTEIQTKRETDRLVQGSVLFTTSPDDTYAFLPEEAATELYGGIEVLYQTPNWIDGLDNTFNREYLTADAGVGAVRYFRKEQFMKMTRPYKWFLRSRADILAFRKFLARMRGRSKTCWIPSWHDDFTLASPVSSSSFIITVAGLDFFRLYAEDKSRTNLMFKTVAGQRYYRSILSVSQLGENSAITMNSPLPVNLTIAQMASINFLLRCRLATDKIDIPWQTDTFADPQTTFTSVPA